MGLPPPSAVWMMNHTTVPRDGLPVAFLAAYESAVVNGRDPRFLPRGVGGVGDELEDKARWLPDGNRRRG